MSTVGILGGTFDPVHEGHTRIALDVAEECVLDSVRFVPNARSPLRDNAFASNEDRVAMLQLALAGQGRLDIDDRELQREPPSYTFDTLRSLRDEMPGTALCFILGVDAFMQFHQWHYWQEIPTLAHLLIAARPGCELVFGNSDLEMLYEDHRTTDVSDLHNSLYGYIYICNVTPVDISATRVRENIRSGKSIKGMVCEPVARYIEEHGLYQ